MPLKTYQKILIGSFIFLVFTFMTATGILLNLIYTSQITAAEELDEKINNLGSDINSEINKLTNNLIETREDLVKTRGDLIDTKKEVESVSGSIGNLDKEIDLLKASAGEDFSGIIEDAVKSVVTIKTNTGSQGTGFIIHEDGYIVTNAHVLANEGGYLASSIQAITFKQKTKDAEFLGHNNELDIALLKISGDYNELDLGNSDRINIGEKVIAIGNPLGLQFSVSQGIVSAVHRRGVNGLEAYIQTDAALNPGNSGGPLINQKGRVIGINNFKISGGENLGFALESNYIEESINEISQKVLNETLI